MNTSLFFTLYNLAHHSSFFDNLIIFMAQFFPYFVIVAAVIFLLAHHEIFQAKEPWRAFKEKWMEIFLVFCAGISGWIISLIMKAIIKSPRPFILFSNVHPLISETNYSFPSGHATFFGGLAIALFLVHRRVGWIFIIFALLIGIARIIAGVHFPVDILSGYILGGVVSVFFGLIFKAKKQ